MMVFSQPKTIVSINKHLYHRLQGFQCPSEATASSCQQRDVMAQISVYTFNCVRITFVCHVSDVFTWIYDIQIANIPIRTIGFRLRRLIDDALYAKSAFVSCHLKTQNLSWVSAYHRHQIDVFSCFGMGFAFDKPV